MKLTQIRPAVSQFKQFYELVSPAIRKLLKGCKHLPTIYVSFDQHIDLFSFLDNHRYFCQQMIETDIWSKVTNAIKSSKETIAQLDKSKQSKKPEQPLRHAYSTLLRARCIQMMFELYDDEQQYTKEDTISFCYMHLGHRQLTNNLYSSLRGIAAFRKFQVLNGAETQHRNLVSEPSPLLVEAQSLGCHQAHTEVLSRLSKTEFIKLSVEQRRALALPVLASSSGKGLALCAYYVDAAVVDGLNGLDWLTRYADAAVVNGKNAFDWLTRSVILGNELGIYLLAKVYASQRESAAPQNNESDSDSDNYTDSYTESYTYSESNDHSSSSAPATSPQKPIDSYFSISEVAPDSFGDPIQKMPVFSEERTGIVQSEVIDLYELSSRLSNTPYPSHYALGVYLLKECKINPAQHSRGLELLHAMSVNEQATPSLRINALQQLVYHYLHPMGQRSNEDLIPAFNYLYRLNQLMPLAQQKKEKLNALITVDTPNFVRYLYHLICDPNWALRFIKSDQYHGDANSPSPLLRYTLMNSGLAYHEKKNIVREAAKAHQAIDYSAYSVPCLEELALILKEIADELRENDPHNHKALLHVLSLIPENSQYRFYYYAIRADHLYVNEIEHLLREYKIHNPDKDVYSAEFLNSYSYKQLKKNALERSLYDCKAILSFADRMLQLGIVMDEACKTDYQTYVKLTLYRQRELATIQTALFDGISDTARENRF